ncbi:hypothetical protein AX769_10605 [Frondihabitans sp. PAMC 28766]|uniref:hypothetical protein n=1 Tax=Frondihabitans sp. PAMC 28766 TaxID=1795630 RepID=UPI00078CB00B|nr:hypothetical protein [Frondihabitans sp. PAMC 28766]AMM20517.1 hypothetical protein AX769_10605 [Frondihabitans sp. PAMC 28766]
MVEVLPGLEAGKGDEWAAVGRLGSGRGNPISESFDAQRANSSGVLGNEELHGVTAHDQLVHNTADPASGYGYFDNRTEALNNTALASTGQSSRVSAYVPPPLTLLQERLRNPIIVGTP